MPKKLDSQREARIRERFQDYPFPAMLKAEIEKLEYGMSRLGLRYRHELTQGAGFIHGGVITTICDIGVAIAIFTMVEEDEKILTIELKINFIAPANGDIYADARILHKGRRTAVGEVDVTDASGTLLAKALVTYYIYKD